VVSVRERKMPRFSKDQIARALLRKETGTSRPPEEFIHSSSTVAVCMETLGLIESDDLKEYASTRTGTHLLVDEEVLSTREFLEMFEPKFRVYLDDERVAPRGWLHVANAEGMLQLLQEGLVKEMSLDHDLGDVERSGTWLVNQIEKLAFKERLKVPPFKVHSMNPVGANYMRRVLGGMPKGFYL
jgi:hypothetical protein